MALENSPVKFRRGRTELPEDISDGYLSLDTDTGKMYSDIEEQGAGKRIAVNGTLFGVSYTDSTQTAKVVDIPGVPGYFPGLTVAVMFTDIDKTLPDPLSLSIVHGETSLIDLPLMSNSDTTMSGVDIDEGVPYIFVCNETASAFVLNSGNANCRPKWKSI